MSEYYLRKWDDPALKQVCHPVDSYDSNLDYLIRFMNLIRIQNFGAGIAAPQVGDNRQVLIAKINELPITIINPEILESSGYLLSKEECLSFPGEKSRKFRRRKIHLRYQNKNGFKIERELKGDDAALVQHEIDHLNGKTIITMDDLMHH